MKLPSAELWRGKQACWAGAEWMGRRRARVIWAVAGQRAAGPASLRRMRQFEPNLAVFSSYFQSLDTYTYCILYMKFFVTNFGYSAE